MNRFGDDDRIFRLFCMNPDLETGPQSAIPTVAAMDDATLRATIANNMTRARYLGIDPTTTALTAPGRYAKGKWRCRLAPRSSGGLRLYILGEKIDPDEVFMIFVGEHLMHISKPLDKEIIRINFGDSLAPDDRVSVVCRSGVLVHNVSGDYWTLDTPTGKITDLRSSVAAGKYLTKKGALLAPKYRMQTIKCDLAGLYASLNACIEEKFGYRLHASHGTLLGMVREGDLIEHDDDFDCAYISRFETCAEVSKERFDIIDHLIAAGFRCKLGVTGHIKVKGKGIEIDLMPAWFDGETYNVSGFTAIPLPREAMLPLGQFRFHGTDIHVPARPEEFLHLNYGHGWRVPDPFYRSVPLPKALQHRRQFKVDQQTRPELL